jgi:hypothetical protein
MIDHNTFTQAYNQYNRWVCWIASKTYPRDPLAVAADAWERVWTNRASIQTVGCGLLLKIVHDLSRTRDRDDNTHLRHLERYSWNQPKTTEDIETPPPPIQFITNNLTTADKRTLRKLKNYAETPDGKMKDTGIPRSTLTYFRKRVKRYKIIEIG